MSKEEAAPSRGPQPKQPTATTWQAVNKSVSQEAAPTEAQLELANRLGVVLKPGDTKVSVYRRIGHVLGLINADLESRAMRWAGQRARA